MPSPWVRAAMITPISLRNRNMIGGLLNKTSEAMSHGIGCHMQYMGSKNFKNLDALNKYKSFPCFQINGIRTYSEKTPGPVPPSPPNLPDKAQVEKAFFRVVAFFWDYGLWLFTWMCKIIQSNVVEKPIVKLYWKRFHEKMEEAKKHS